jgi:hypothetical protein
LVTNKWGVPDNHIKPGVWISQKPLEQIGRFNIGRGLGWEGFKEKLLSACGFTAVKLNPLQKVTNLAPGRPQFHQPVAGGSQKNSIATTRFKNSVAAAPDGPIAKPLGKFRGCIIPAPQFISITNNRFHFQIPSIIHGINAIG